MIYLVTAIGTDSGKTLVSAIVTKALRADYWKPIQAGLPRDTEQVKQWTARSGSVFHPEAYRLQTPASPHAAARIDGVALRLSDIHLPTIQSDNLVIEGAGGMLVPLNAQEFVIDLAAKFEAEVILVANLYLGSINHTLLSVQELKRRQLKVKGIIFNGEPNPDSESFILHYSGYRCLLRIEREPQITPEVVDRYAAKLLENWDSVR